MFSPIPDILDDLRAGKMVILTDDEHRENEGDLVLPAQFITPEAITFMLSVARGYMCLSLTEADCDRLDLHPQAAVNTTARGTAFTISIDGHPRHGFTTGVSAKERARCIRMAIDPASGPGDFVRPGHINPLRSRDGGVLVRTGQTEGSVDLCRLAGLYPAAVIIEIMRDDGEMARVPDLIPLARAHGLKMASVAQIIEHRLSRESLIRRMDPPAGRIMKTGLGDFHAMMFESLVDPLPHLVLTTGGLGVPDPSGNIPDITEPTLVRMHRRHLLGDVFGDLESSSHGPTGDVLRASMAAIQRAGRGAIVYLRTQGADGRGEAALDAVAPLDLEARLQSIRRPRPVQGSDDPELTHPEGAPGLPKAMREFGVGCQILRALGLSRLRLLTNHATTLPGIEAFGLEIVERLPIGPGAPAIDPQPNSVV
ncbi:MAG: 3,4-dihydroxy-2-butanone-4-phosphate synthase [Phycisphaerales bacterium]|nr:3,4-dihydroxy-2-butanone-4-phosphate synthase [Phycisphaerales bacterium]